MKKTTLIILSTFLLIVLFLMLASCDFGNGEIDPDKCEHKWSEWQLTNNSTNCEDAFYWKFCQICKKEDTKPANLSHQFSDKYLYDENSHWIKCINCEMVVEKELHNIIDKECTKCEYVVQETEGVMYTISNDGTYAIVTGYEGIEYYVYIASEYEGVPVTHIGEFAFAGLAGVYGVKIPNSVTTICDRAFAGCYELGGIVSPDSVTSIGDYAFGGIYMLHSVQIGSNVNSIGKHAFDGCYNLSDVTIPGSVKSIGDYAFYECSGIINLTISAGVNSIGYNAFGGCSNLTSVVIPDSVTFIGYSSFSNCENLRDVYYTGNEKQWDKITIGGDYDSSLERVSITIHYNYVPEE